MYANHTKEFQIKKLQSTKGVFGSAFLDSTIAERHIIQTPKLFFEKQK